MAGRLGCSSGGWLLDWLGGDTVELCGDSQQREESGVWAGGGTESSKWESDWEARRGGSGSPLD